MHCYFCLLDGRSQFLRHTDYTILHEGEIRKTTFNFQGCEYFRPYIKERTAVATANQTHLNMVQTPYNLHRVSRTRQYAVGYAAEHNMKRRGYIGACDTPGEVVASKLYLETP
jgi:hypothetical protein